jgi:opacity protein-like surface antigen
MKKLFFYCIILLPVSLAHAQRLWLTTFAGISNYQGDLQDKKFTLQQAHFAAGIGASYEITDQLYVTGNIKIGKLSGNDRTETKNVSRNLDFSSSLSEFHLGLEYDLINLNEQPLTPYVFAGLAVYHFNPYTFDSVGKKTYLQPLGTEGQGFYNGRTKYSLTQISIPFGGGIKLAVTENVRIGFEIGFRKLFTDYLDDVSATYADKTLLIANNGQTAADLAFRGGELKTGLLYPGEGARRGNAGSKDWYYFSGVSVSFRLGASENSRNGGTSRTSCPARVY